jgi:hypothetical protein
MQTYKGKESRHVGSALKMKTACSSEMLYPPTSPHCVTTQKTNIDILTTVRTSNLKL